MHNVCHWSRARAPARAHTGSPPALPVPRAETEEAPLGSGARTGLPICTHTGYTYTRYTHSLTLADCSHTHTNTNRPDGTGLLKAICGLSLDMKYVVLLVFLFTVYQSFIVDSFSPNKINLRLYLKNSLINQKKFLIYHHLKKSCLRWYCSKLMARSRISALDTNLEAFIMLYSSMYSF